MESFWSSWAAREARQQWYIYSGSRLAKDAPEVESVRPDADSGTFRVLFANGDEMAVSPSCIARPTVRFNRALATDQPTG